MKVFVSIFFLMVTGFSVVAQPINVRGTVSTSAAQPIANAVVSLEILGLKDTTSVAGAYSLTPTAVKTQPLFNNSGTVRLNNGILTFNLLHPVSVKVELFDVQGTLLQKTSLQKMSTGLYQFNVRASHHAAKVLIIKASIDRQKVTLRYLPLQKNNGTATVPDEISSPVAVNLAKIAAITDTIKISAAGYSWKSVPITSYDTTVNITLDTTGTGPFLNGFFPIGIFGQRQQDFSKWKSRGLNTLFLVSLDDGTDLADWESSARAAGLRTIRQPLPNPADDIGNTNLLAWSQMDEPDAGGLASFNNLQPCINNYKRWKSIDPTRPVFLNFAGPDVLTAVEGPLPSWCVEATGYCSWAGNYKRYIDESLDWASNDIYPVGGWLPDENRRNDLTLIGDVLDRIRTWTDKPQIATIECSDQRYVPEATRGLTPGELRAQMWIAIVHGARGLCYFAAWFSPPYMWAGWDNTTAGNVAEMQVQHPVITSLAPVLQGVINPPSLGITVPSPLQACWREANGQGYFIVVNPTGIAQTNVSLMVKGVPESGTAAVYSQSRNVTILGGKITDSFPAFGVNIYVIQE
jgi:hypothetical protein